MIFDTRSTQAAQAGLDSLWLQTKVIANNIANMETPGFKAERVSFSQVLGKATQDLQATSQNRAPQTQQLVQANQQNPSNRANPVNRGAASGDVYRTRITSDPNTTVRVDGNNVSLEHEQSELWKVQAQYSYLMDRIKSHYSNISKAIGNMRT